MKMKKRIVSLCALALMASLAACGTPAPKGDVTTEVTWDELLAANTLDAVFEKTGSFSSSIGDSSGETYTCFAAMVDGELIYSTGSPGYTDDLRNGIQYHASPDDTSKSIIIMAPTANLNDLIDEAYGEELRDYQVPDKIYVNDSQYFAKLYSVDEEYGITSTGYAYFDTETLLLDRMELVEKMGSFKNELSMHMAYGTGADFAQTSYDSVVNADDALDLTIHYPDGTTTDITVDRDVSVMAHHPKHTETWSVCWDEACTGRVDDLGWITDGHGDVYLCEGDVAMAPPTLNRVLEKSSFDVMFKENYDTYFQTTFTMNKDEIEVQCTDLAWYVDEEAGLCLNFEIKDADYNVVRSGRARDYAWYSWTEKDGYRVDFFDDFSYAEDLVKEYRLFLYEEQLGEPMTMDEGGYAYYIPYEETVGNGVVKEYKYYIHTDSDFIERVEITKKDSAQNVLGYEHCYIGGNGPIAGDLDIFAAVSQPEDAETVMLTVVSPIGEKTYSIRKDAKISWKGGALYSDETCTKSVSNLNWVNGPEATVYVK